MAKVFVTQNVARHASFYLFYFFNLFLKVTGKLEDQKES